MSLRMKVALWIFVPSALLAIANAWAFRAFPNQWGGPNIGGGGIQLLAYIGVIVGVSFFIAALVQWRRHRRSQ